MSFLDNRYTGDGKVRESGRGERDLSVSGL